MAKSKDFWDKAAPKNTVQHHLDKEQKKEAKARARANGRPYPNLVDNAAAARAGHSKRGK